MEKERTLKRITECRGIAVRRIGRPRVRWEDDVREDLGKMEVQNCSQMAVGRETWRKFVEQAKNS